MTLADLLNTLESEADAELQKIAEQEYQSYLDNTLK